MVSVISIPVIAYYKLELTIHQTNMDGRPLQLDLGHQNVIYIKCRMGETITGQFFNVPQSSDDDKLFCYNVTALTVLTLPKIKNIYIGNPDFGARAFNGIDASKKLGLIFQDKTITVQLADGYNGQFLYGRSNAAITPAIEAEQYIGFYTITLERELS